MISKTLISVLIVGSILVLILAFISRHLESMNERTCSSIIEGTVENAINHKEIRLETFLDSSWKELDSIQRQQLLNYAKDNAPQNNECMSYPYFIKGEDETGTKLPIFGRKGSSGWIELRLGNNNLEIHE
jgi:hypothetical protein